MNDFRAQWTTWHNAQLIENSILEIGDGYRAKNNELGLVGLPFARAGNIDNGFHFEDADLLDEVNVHKAGSKISRPGDVVFTSKGTVGRFAFVRPETPKFVYSPQLCYWRIKDSSILDPRFLFYWMHGRDFTNQVHKVKGLTDMADYVSLGDQRRMTITAPQLHIQCKIASILSAYDDLIENNTRRMAILEEMVQSLYREWFVHFRFPGHAKKRLVESELGLIPEGWEVKKVGELVNRQPAGITYTESNLFNEGRVPVIDQSKDEFLGFHNDIPDHLASPENPIIIFGDHTCKMRLMSEPFSVGPNVIPFLSRAFIPIQYLYFVLSDLVKTKEYKRHWTELINKKVILADITLSAKFAKHLTPLIEFNNSLKRKNILLQKTRDLLLPKLISGEVDVEGLDIHIEGGTYESRSYTVSTIP